MFSAITSSIHPGYYPSYFSVCQYPTAPPWAKNPTAAAITVWASAYDFLKAFEKNPEQLMSFSVETWQSLVVHATVYSKDDIRFTFKNGQEVKA